MRCSSPAGRVAAVIAGGVALVVGGVAYAETGTPPASHIDAPASASDTAFRVTTTTTTAPFVTAPEWDADGPGTLLFPMNPEPYCFLRTDSFGAGRGGRTHQGLDIMAGTDGEGRPVYAVEDGELYRQWVDGEENTERSGNGWNLRGTSGTTYSFLHLSGFAPGLEVGSDVVAGQLIGFVGDTGNADDNGPGNYHLHFEVHPGGGSAVDPYPLLDIPVSCDVATL